MSDQEKIVTGQEIIISSAAKMNRIRDIGLWLVVMLLAGHLFLTWVDVSNQSKFEEHRNASQDAAIKKNEMTLEKLGNLIKSDMAGEHKRTREMMFKAWLDHDAKLKKLTEAVERLEKGKKSE